MAKKVKEQFIITTKDELTGYFDECVLAICSTEDQALSKCKDLLEEGYISEDDDIYLAKVSDFKKLKIKIDVSIKD